MYCVYAVTGDHEAFPHDHAIARVLLYVYTDPFIHISFLQRVILRCLSLIMLKRQGNVCASHISVVI